MSTLLEVELATRLSFSREQRAFTRGVSIFAALGMALGVASLIVVLSVMNGLAGELTGRLLNSIPHVEIKSDDPLRVQAVVSQLAPEGLSVTTMPYIRRQLMLRGEFTTAGAELTGLGGRPQEALGLTVIDGDLGQVMTTRYQAALGEALARNLGVGIGDRIDAVLPAVAMTPFGLLPRYRHLTVGALISVGASPDASMVLTSLDTASRLSSSSKPDGVRLQLSDAFRADELAGHIEFRSDGQLRTVTWTEAYQSLFAAIRMEKLMVGTLLGALIAVAAFSVVSSLTMSVAEKRSDIASLRVLGLTPDSIRRVFIMHGLVLAALGIVVGLVLGVALTLYLEQLMRLAESVLGWTLFDPSIYYIGGLPTELQWRDVSFILLGALALSLLAAVYPAHRASKISPVLALEGLDA